MKDIIITVSNKNLPNLKETYFCPRVDMSDLNEVKYCAEECCGSYLDKHGDYLQSVFKNLDWTTIAQTCYYTIEEA